MTWEEFILALSAAADDEIEPQYTDLEVARGVVKRPNEFQQEFALVFATATADELRQMASVMAPGFHRYRVFYKLRKEFGDDRPVRTSARR